MKIYIDLILILNLGFDFILLFAVSKILKRKTDLNKLLISSFIGSLTTLTLFIKITSLNLFIIKIVASIIMTITAFQYKNIKYTLKNIIFLYIVSIVLGGSLYLLNLDLSYKNNGIIFYHNGLSINFIILLISVPIIIIIYVKEMYSIRNNYAFYHTITIYYKDYKQTYTGFLDTGNTLIDPYKKRPVILINDKTPFGYDYNKIYIPANTVIGNNIIECIKPAKIEIDKKEIKQEILVGYMKHKIRIDGIDCILNYKVMEELND